MSGTTPKPKAQISPAELIAEASAYRITPTYVYGYKYKDGSKALGLVPVRIKHANVFRHWPDLVDPDPSSPLSNAVIGTIPKYYKAVTDLQPKDPSHPVSALMTKDGPSATAEPVTPRTAVPMAVAAAKKKVVPLGDYLTSLNFNDPKAKETLLKSPALQTSLEKQFGKDWKQQAVALGFDIPGVKAPPPPIQISPEAAALAVALKYKPNSPEAEALHFMLQEGELNLAVEEYIKAKGQKKVKVNLEPAFALMVGVYVKAHKKKLADPVTKLPGGEVKLALKPALVPSAPAPSPAPAPAPTPAPVPSPVAAPPAPAPQPEPEPTPMPAPEVLLKPSQVYSQLQFATLNAYSSAADEAFKNGGETLQQAYEALLQKLNLNSANYAQTLPAKHMVGALFTHLKATVGFQEQPDYTKKVGPYLSSVFGSSMTQSFLEAAQNVRLTKAVQAAANKARFDAYVSEAPTQLTKMEMLRPGVTKAIEDVLGTKIDMGQADDTQEAEKSVEASLIVANLWGGSADALETQRFLRQDFGKKSDEIIKKLFDAGIYSVSSEGPPYESDMKVPVAAAPAPAPTAEPEIETNSAVAAGKAIYAAIFPGKSPAYTIEPSRQNFAMLAALAVYQPEKHGHMLTYLKNALAPLVTDPSVNVKAVALDFAAKAKQQGLYALGPISGSFVINPDLKKAAIRAGLIPAEPTPAPVPMPAPAPAPEPEKPPAAMPPAPQTKKLSDYVVPPLPTLKFAGDAKASLKGYHPKFFLTDGSGNKYLFKPAEQMTANAGAVYSDIASLVLGKDKVVSVVAGTVPGRGFGSVQPMIPNKGDLTTVDLTKLTPAQLDTLMGERVLDWALSTHDTKAANFLIGTDGQIFGIDKEQAFRFIGQDELNLTYKPNPTKQVYSDIFGLYKQKKLSVNLGALFAPIQKIESITDDEWMARVSPYLNSLPDAEKQKKSELILARKKSLRKDFESFLTDLLRGRGDIGPTDTFVFEVEDDNKKSKTVSAPPMPADTASSAAPPMGSVLIPPSVPSMASLAYVKKATDIGGAGEKHFFVDGNGARWMLKIAKNKSPPFVAEPFRAAAQEIFSQISSVVRPGKSVPVGAVTAPASTGSSSGFPATIQQWLTLAPNATIGKNTDPATLKPSEVQDILEEHALDWMLSQHDSHGDNLVRRADGAIIGIDKEQGFKFFLGDFGEADSLSTTYHPNKVESAPYYNRIWSAFASKQIDFDPKVMLGAIERVEKISDSDYTKLLAKFGETAPFKNNPAKVSEFYAKALARKQNLRADFESFITGLYKKRENSTSGVYTFAEGWQPDGTKKKKPVAFAAPLVVISDMSSDFVANPKSVYVIDDKVMPKQIHGSTLAAIPYTKDTANVAALRSAILALPSKGAEGAAAYALTKEGKTPVEAAPWLQTAAGGGWTASEAGLAIAAVLGKLAAEYKSALASISAAKAALAPKPPEPAPTAPTPSPIDPEMLGFLIDTYLPEPLTKDKNVKESKKIAVMLAALLNYSKLKDGPLQPYLFKALKESFPEESSPSNVPTFITNADAAGLIQWDDASTGFVVLDKLKLAGSKANLATGIAPAPAPTPTAPPEPAAALSTPPAGYKPPSPSALMTAMEQMGIAPSGVYAPAVKALASAGTVEGAIATLVAAGVPPEIAQKRVKYAKKKLDSVGGFAAPVSPPAVSPAQEAGPKKAVTGVLLSDFAYPLSSGALHALDAKMVTANAPALQATKPKTPEGYPEPPEGKMWEIKAFSAWQAAHVYKVKPPKDASGKKIEDSDKVLIKFKDYSVADATEFLKKNNIQTFTDLGNAPVFSKELYTVALVSKPQWEELVSKAPNQAQLIDIPPPKLVSTADKFTTIPEQGQLGNTLAAIGAEGLKTLADNKQIGYGTGFMADGNLVEQMSVQVQRMQDSSGEYYRFNFKLRTPAWNSLKNKGTATTYKFPRADYNPKTDAWNPKPGDDYADRDKFAARMFSSQGSTLYIGSNNSDKRAYRGFVVAEVRPQQGETVYDAFKRTLAAADPTFADQLLATPTEDEVKLLKASALHWSYFPKKADALTQLEEQGNTTARNLPALLSDLSAAGFTEADVDSIRFEQVALGQIAPVLPGRLERMKKAYPQISHLAVSVSADSIDNLVNQICGGTVGVTQRLLIGRDPEGTSVAADQRTGGAEYVFGKIVEKSGKHTPTWNSGLQMVFDPSELERLDSFIIDKDVDGYGCCYGEDYAKGSAWKNRVPLEQGISTQWETLVRKGVSARKLLKVLVPSPSIASQLIARLKQLGVTKINGMLPEELVMAKGSDSTFYSTHLSPAGY